MPRSILLAVPAVFLLGCGGDSNPTPLPGSPAAESFLTDAQVMIGAGDIAVCGNEGDEGTAAIVDSVLRADSTDDMQSVVFTLGDNAYPSGSRGNYNFFGRCFTPSWGKPRIMSIIRPSPGNHDFDRGSPEPYFTYFGDKAGPRDRGYYSYDFAGWHVVSLNSEIMTQGNTQATKAQLDWLREDLKEHPALCTLAYFHRPLFSSGRHGPDNSVRRFWDILYDAHADLILSGHEHHYERFRPQNPRGEYDPTNGIVEIIAGTGGANLRTIEDPVARNSVQQIHGRFGVLKLMIGKDEFRHVFIDTKGRVWDPGGGKCH